MTSHMTNNDTVPPFKRLSGQGCLKNHPSPLPTVFPRIPRCNNRAVTQPIRCHGSAEASLFFLFMLWNTPPRHTARTKADGKTKAIFVSLSTFHQRGLGARASAGGDEDSVSDRNKCSLSSLTSVPGRDVCWVEKRKRRCLL